jgi:hypothetical protein
LPFPRVPVYAATRGWNRGPATCERTAEIDILPDATPEAEGDLVASLHREAPVVAVLSAMAKADPAILDEFLAGIGNHLGGAQTHAAALSRLLLIYIIQRLDFAGVSKHHDHRALRPGTAAYGAVEKEIAAFHDALIGQCPHVRGQLSPPTGSQTLRNFALGISDEPSGQGATYRLLGIFIAAAALANSNLERLPRVTREDRELLAVLKKQCNWLQDGPKPLTSPLSDYRPVVAPLVAEGDDVDVMRKHVARFFHFPPERVDRLGSYLHRVAHGPKGYACFACFRPQLSHPNRLVKSFLAIVPPGANGLKNYYTFAHYYRLDHGSLRKRRAVGVVLPMARGLYFVGGETVVQDNQPVMDEYRTLKVLALPWIPIEQDRTILSGLELSSNNEEVPIVSRVAFRPTLLHSDDLLDTRSFDIGELGDDLAAIAAREEDVRDRPPAFRIMDSLDEQKERILARVNNRPPLGASGFFRRTNHSPISVAAIGDLLDQAFLNQDSFVDGAGNAFHWNDLRFGALEPLTH